MVYYIRTYLLVFLLLQFAALNGLQAQTYIFGQLTGSPMNISGWTLYGSTAIGNTGTNTSNEELILCPALTDRSGGIFFNNPINLNLCNNKWIVEFDFRMFDGNMADGLAFCFVDMPPAGFVTGEGLGIPATLNGLKVCFDTFLNCGTEPAPKIQIRWGMGYGGECSIQPTRINTGGTLSFLRSPGYNRARIEYNNGLISVYVNNVLYLTSTQTFNFTGYFGFTASTGGFTDNHSIKSVAIYTEMPAAAPGPDKITCSGQPVQIGSPSQAGNLYEWTPATGLSDPNISNPTVTLSNSGSTPVTTVYTLKTALSASPGCASTGSVRVTVRPQKSTTISQTICEGQRFEGYTISGTYVDKFTSAAGCDSIRTLQLTVKKVTQPYLGRDTSICLGDTIVLSPGSFLSYLWQDGSTYNSFTVTRPGLYTVKVYNGCYDLKDEIRITNGICDIYFPNSFTPNGDCNNDIFKALTGLKPESYRLTIYNRWGQKIFETTNLTDGWDGKFKGKNQPPGVFVWVAIYKIYGKGRMKKGTLTLIR